MRPASGRSFYRACWQFHFLIAAALTVVSTIA